MNDIPSIPSGLTLPQLITAANDRLRRIQTALAAAATTTTPTVTVVERTSPSTGATTTDVGNIDSVSAVDASTLPASNPNYFAHWTDPAGVLHTVVNATVAVTTNNSTSQLITLWLNQGAGQLWLGWFAVSPGSQIVKIGLAGSGTSYIWTPIGANGSWTVTAAFGGIGEGAAVPAGAVTSPAFVAYCRSGSYAQVQNPIAGQYAEAEIQVQNVLANGNPGGFALLGLATGDGGIVGYVKLQGDDGENLTLLPETTLAASAGAATLPANPLGFLVCTVTSKTLPIGSNTAVKIPIYLP